MTILKINGRIDPIGLDEIPSFSWVIPTNDQKDIVQLDYRIKITEIQNQTIVWDSQVVESEQSIAILYEGDALLPFRKYDVVVEVTDNLQRHLTFSGAFETGYLETENWEGQWLTSPQEDRTKVPVFIKKIEVKSKVKQIRLYASACGVYDVLVNGAVASDHYMAPGWTAYQNRLAYQTYDLTPVINIGENTIAFRLAKGWYSGVLGFDGKPNNYGDITAISSIIMIEYQDGYHEMIVTDGSWQVYQSEIISSEIYAGEVQDYTHQYQTEGMTVGEMYGQAKVIPCPLPETKLVSQENEPLKVNQRLKAVKKFLTPKQEVVIDFGQNHAGVVAVRLPKIQGQKLVISHAESLDNQGNFYTKNLRTAYSKDEYIYDEVMFDQTVHPYFTYHGYRYIKIEGIAFEQLEIERFESLVIYSAMPKIGNLTTSNLLVNQLVSNVEWGQRSNFFDVPTDCPQRNERLGWTGDAQMFAGTASFSFNTSLFFRKWLRDVSAETTSTYGVPHVVPNIIGQQAGAAAWSDAITIIPWTLYQMYGDMTFLSENYPAMQTWVAYIEANTNESGLWQNGFQYGDWLALDIEKDSIDRTGGTDKYLVANAYYAYSTKILRDTAEILGDYQNYERYDVQYSKVIAAIQAEYVTPTGRLVSETQTAAVLMIYFELLQTEFYNRAMDALVDNLARHRNHLTTGFVGTPYILHLLSEQNQHELAAEVFNKEDLPSWFYAIKMGATTIWERWNSILPDGNFEEKGNMNSLNHYAYGSVLEWLYRKVAGINQAAPGFKKIIIKPLLTTNINHVKAEFNSPYGLIMSEIHCENGQIDMFVIIPANTRATIIFPEGNGEVEVGSGTYEYHFETITSLNPDKYTTDSTLGELVNAEGGRQLFDELAPGMLDNPMIEYAYDMTVSELLAQSTDGKPLFEAILQKLNC